MIYVCSAPVLVGCNVFWIFVVTVLLNTKSLLIVTKQLVFFFAQKSINNLLHQMFFKWCTCTIFWPSEIPWCVDKCIIEGWWWYSETSEIIILHFWSVLSYSKKTLYFVPIACQCMLANCGANTQKPVWSAYVLRITVPTELCFTYPEM